jgi:uncharacterized protein (DUF924 family)
MQWTKAVIDFWFKELTPEQWFGGGAALDAAIKLRFSACHEELKHALPSLHALDAEGHLAAVIVFDQFPRNIFRGTKQAFETDSLARAITEHALDHELDEQLSEPQCQFLYMPLMHSEDVDLQNRSVALFSSLGLDMPLDYAKQHHDVIKQFGRFPQRNAVLGRTSTDAEQKFLATTTYKW